jgi:hypothetical protein
MTIDEITRALKAVRIGNAAAYEIELQRAIASALIKAGAEEVATEYTFAPRCRADIWCDGVVIEVKKRRPSRAAIVEQLTRYAVHPLVGGVILVSEMCPALPGEIVGKPCRTVSIAANWGLTV